MLSLLRLAEGRLGRAGTGATLWIQRFSTVCHLREPAVSKDRVFPLSYRYPGGHLQPWISTSGYPGPFRGLAH